MPSMLHAQIWTHTDTLPDMFTMVRGPVSELDTNAIPTQLLAEGTLPMADISLYSGSSIPHDSLAVDEPTYQDQYITAFGMAMTRAKVAELMTEEHIQHHDFARDTAYLHGLALSFNRISPNAFSTGLLLADTIANRIFDVPNSSTSPYDTDTLTTIGIAGGRRDTLDVQMRFRRADLLGELATGTQFWLDQGQGFIKHDFDSLFTLNFSSYEDHILIVRINTVNGFRYAKVQLSLKQASVKGPEDAYDDEVTFFSDNTGWPLGKYFIKYSGACEDKLTRPLIVVNGFDPTNEGVLRLERLTREFQGYTFSEGHRFADNRLGQVLQDDEYYGYDLIFITFDNGKASNITTAEWLMAAIKSINFRKQDDGVTEASPIIGVSMGGITTKIAISMMEDEGYDHNLSKFFSFDTPFQGANIPLGLQHSIAHFYFGKVNGVLIRKLACDIRHQGRQLFNDAAAEMLLQRAEARVRYRSFWINDIVHETSEDIHLAFRDYMDGIDIDVPHYAISNGSNVNDMTVVGQGSTPQLGPNTRLMRSETFAIATNFKVQAYNAPGTIMKIEVWSLLPLGITTTRYPLLSNYTPAINLDLEPGGTRGMNDPALVESPCDDGWFPFGGTKYFVDYHSFVPTWSALNNRPGGSRFAGGPGVDFVFSDNEELTSRHSGAAQAGHRVFNHAHVSVTPGIANFLVEHLDPGFRVTSSGNQVNTLANEFNYGSGVNSLNGPVSTPDILFGILQVNNGGGLFVNKALRIADVSNTLNPQNNTDPFHLTLTTGPCDSPPADITLQSGANFVVGENGARIARVTALQGTRVTVQNGGTLEVNDVSTFALQSDGPDGNGGIVVESGGVINAKHFGRIIADGGVIRVQSGGILRTVDQGQIIARNGGRIILEDGALIQWWGNVDAKEGDGQIWIQEGTLEIQGDYQLSGNGYFHFSKGNAVVGPGPLKIVHDGRENRRMYVDHGTSVTLTGQEFYARDARIIYEGLGGLTLREGSEADVSSCVFEGGLASINTDLSAKAYIRHSDFRDSRTAIEFVTKDIAGGSATVRNCTFTNCAEGVVAQHKGDAPLSVNSYPSIYSSEFVNCEYGLYIEDHPSVSAYSSSFTSSNEEHVAIDATNAGRVNLVNCEVFGYQNEQEDAIAIISDKVSDFRLDAGEYHDNSTVMEVYATSDITLTECVKFSSNNIGIDCFAASTIDFNGSVWTSTAPAVQSANAAITVTSTKSNSFALSGVDPFFQFESAGSVTMNNNSWTGQTNPDGTPISGSWFDVSPTVIVNTIGGGCGSDCQNPDDCRRFCEYYPESDYCQIEPPIKEFKGGVKEGEMTLYPNPANGQVTVANLPDDQAFDLTIFSSTGQGIMQFYNMNRPMQELDVTHLVPGFYMLQLSTVDGETQQLRFSVAR